MFKVQINIQDNRGANNFHWETSFDSDVTRAALVEAMQLQIHKAQRGAASVIGGARIGRIRPTNLVTFSVQEFDGFWHDIEVQEQLAQLGNMRLCSKSNGEWKYNDFEDAIDFVLITMGIE